MRFSFTSPLSWLFALLVLLSIVVFRFWVGREAADYVGLIGIWACTGFQPKAK